MIEVKNSKIINGRGAFATEDLKKGLELNEDVFLIKDTPLFKTNSRKQNPFYYHQFLIRGENSIFEQAIAMGWPTFINSTNGRREANIKFVNVDEEKLKMNFILEKDVKKGEELFLEYNVN